MLHIVFGESAGGALRLALRQADRDDELLSFNDDLSFGPIDPPNPIVRAAWARTELYFPDATTATLADSLDRFWQRARLVKNAWCGFHGTSSGCEPALFAIIPGHSSRLEQSNMSRRLDRVRSIRRVASSEAQEEK
jgi:hypothetical protein